MTTLERRVDDIDTRGSRSLIRVEEIVKEHARVITERSREAAEEHRRLNTEIAQMKAANKQDVVIAELGEIKAQLGRMRAAFWSSAALLVAVLSALLGVLIK